MKAKKIDELVKVFAANVQAKTDPLNRIKRLRKARILLCGFRSGRVFHAGLVNTGGATICYVSEAFNPSRLCYAKNVTSMCIEYELDLYITEIDGCLTYLIY